MLSRPSVVAWSLVSMCLGASPALAAGTIGCQSTGHLTRATLEVTVGQLAALVPVSLTVTVGNLSWSTSHEAAMIPIAILQSYDDGQSLRIDATDPNLLELLFSIRLMRAADARDLAHVGILELADGRAFSLVCEGP